MMKSIFTLQPLFILAAEMSQGLSLAGRGEIMLLPAPRPVLFLKMLWQ